MTPPRPGRPTAAISPSCRTGRTSGWRSSAPPCGSFPPPAARRAGSRPTTAWLVGGERACGLLSVSADGQTLAYAVADLLHPPDLYVAGPDGRDERRLSRLNPWLEDMSLSQPRPLAVTSADALPIDAWLIPPAGAAEPVPGPLVLDIHGGPHSTFGHVLFFDMQLLNAQGYGVLF